MLQVLDDPSRSLSRRAFVVLGTIAPLVACSPLDSEPAATPPPVPHPDMAVRRRAVVAESSLIALYAAAAHDHPDLADRLEPFRSRHDEHRAALAAVPIPVSPAATAATATSPTASASPAPEAPRPSVPPDPSDALDELVAAEAAAAEARLADCLDARGRELATVLACVAAAEAAHERLLRGVVS